MTFSAQVKEELVRIRPGKPCCMLSELGALTQACGTLSLRGGGRVQVVYRVDSAALARRIFLLLKARIGVTPTLEVARGGRPGAKRTCCLTVDEGGARRLLLSLHMLRETPDGQTEYRRLPRRALTRQCCRRAFLRGAFLGCGSLVQPEKGNHLEFSTSSEALAQAIERVLEKCDVACKRASRREAHVIYLKDGEQIVSLLRVMGAAQSLMAMENVRAQKQVRNRVNRMMNCDQSNLDKQLSAAQQQVRAITRLSLAAGLGKLPPELEAVARLRLSRPDASIAELGALLDPPLSKSGVNHRLRRLCALADNLQQNDEITSEKGDVHHDSNTHSPVGV